MTARISSLLILVSSLHVQAQQGINFQKAASWQGVLDTAKKQHKYIFVDCYATWCEPCKAMDENVYNEKHVGDAFNEKFISVKLQMDKTPKDDERIRNWYSVVETLEQYYHVNVYPTFLFFDEEGTPVHKAVGYREAVDFVKLAADAQNPERQYYNLLQHFNPGTIDTSELKGLARSFFDSDKDLAGKLALDYLSRISATDLSRADNRELMLQFRDNDPVYGLTVRYLRSLSKESFAYASNLSFVGDLSNKKEVIAIARRYINSLSEKELGEKENLNFVLHFGNDSTVREIATNYIDHLTVNELLSSKEQIRFLAAFSDTITARGFGIFYLRADKVNGTMGNGTFAQDEVDYMINRSEIQPLIEKAKQTGIKPDFDSLAKLIKRKYSQYYSDRIMAAAKIDLGIFLIKKTTTNWQQYLPDLISNRIAQIMIRRLDTAKSSSNFINDVCWLEIYLSSDDKGKIDTAIHWMKEVTERKPNDADYLDTYANLLYKAGYVREAVKVEERAQRNAPDDKGISENLAGMKKGEKVWLYENHRAERDKYFGH
jgi:thioredoxin-related protein